LTRSWQIGALGPIHAGHRQHRHLKLHTPNSLLDKEKLRSERDSNPRYRLTRYTAFPESVRDPTGPVPNRLLNTNGTVRPTATDWLRPLIGIGVGIGGLAIANVLDA